MKSYKTIGYHILADFWGVDAELLNDGGFLEDALCRAARLAGATIRKKDFEKFEPQGVSVAVILSESHITIHTYPEKGFAAIDVYTCRENVDPMKAVDYLSNILKPTKQSVKTMVRGVGEIREVSG